MIYSYIDYEDDILVDINDNEHDIHKRGLEKLISECDFVVTKYGTMYSTESLEVRLGSRGWGLSAKLEIDSHYNIQGGYKLDT